MKKYAIFALLFAAVAAFAAFDVTKAPNVIPVAAPQTIADGTTNYAAGGWTPYVSETIANTNAFTQMIAFPADGLTFDLKLDIGSIGEASNVSAFILCY